MIPTVSTAGWCLLVVAAIAVGIAKTALPGAATLAVALFAAVLPARASTGALLILLLVGDVVAIAAYRHDADWATLRRLVPGVVLGLVLGAGFLTLAGDRATAVLIGVPLVAALAAGAGTRALWVRMRRAMPRNAIPLTPGELVGTDVRVLWWRNGRGEVMATSRGHQLTLEARSDDSLRTGSTAVVLEAADDVLVVTSLALDA